MRKSHQVSYFGAIGLALVFCSLSVQAETVTITPEEKADKWVFLGRGSRAAQNRMFYMEESQDSNGVMVFSPETFEGNVTVRYEIMPMNPASICVALLFASDRGENQSLTFPDPESESPDIALGAMDNYFFVFHNVAHNRKPFLRRFPGANLMEIDKNVVRSGQFHQIEVGRRGNTLWLEVDGERIIEVEDPEPHTKGHIGFRIRGISQMPAACLIRNVTITTATE